MNRSFISLIIIIIIIFGWSYLASCSQIVGKIPQSVKDIELMDGDSVRVEAWVENLEIPWSLVFLSDKKALVSERAGRIRLITDGVLMKEPYTELNVAHIGEGGLMGLAVHPDFPRRPYVYAMYTYRDRGDVYNRIVRLKDKGDRGVFDRIIFDRIPGGRFHNGGRITFGPDGMLYITTGETFNAEIAQDIHSYGGKILRITPDGEIPHDNPFPESPVYSYGHRNPQGLSWDSYGTFFSSEHGPSGEHGHFAHDEINIIRKGGNYGWPDVIGAGGKEGYIDPIIVWKNTTPPSGITFYSGKLMKHLKGDLFVATLRSEALIRIKFDRTDGNYRVKRIERWFKGKYGRLRDVVEGPDGALYLLTSNKDGRGNPSEGDDKIYRITHEGL